MKLNLFQLFPKSNQCFFCNLFTVKFAILYANIFQVFAAEGDKFQKDELREEFDLSEHSEVAIQTDRQTGICVSRI